MMTYPVGQATGLANAGVNTAVFPIPSAQLGKKSTPLILGPGLLMLKSTKDPALSWALIKEAMNQESMISLAQVTLRLPSRLAAFQTWRKIYEQKTADAQYVQISVESGRGLPYNSKWNDMNAAIRKGLDELFKNTKPASEIFTGIARNLEALYKD
jgi:ABC-type glycerol-3-phosphate transport system substrate-binding protein